MRPILLIIGLAIAIIFGVGTKIKNTSAPTTASNEPIHMMIGAKGLPTSHYDDYTVVFGP